MATRPDDTEPFDLFVIGGGVNGCGVARDAAGRGYRTALAEKDDLASGTSSRSTKLIHGGLRYLETMRFRLVREALAEREILLKIAPHLVRPLRFTLPIQPGRRPAPLLRFGLFLYDFLAQEGSLPPTSTLDLRGAPEGAPLQPDLTRAYQYSDCQTDDCRLVILNARDAADRGAVILTRTEVLRAQPESGLWRVSLRDRATGAKSEISTRLIVNAAGPWADGVKSKLTPGAKPRLRLVRGSHIVVEKQFDHDGAYIFQAPDGRFVFAIAYEDHWTLIGTTDADYAGDPDAVAVTEDEKAYLCAAANTIFARKIAPADSVWSFSGLRPLHDHGAASASKAARDYVIADEQVADAPLIHIFGAKLTAYRHVAELVMERAAKLIGRRGARWTADALLPGGNILGDDPELFALLLRAEYPFLAEALARRLVRSYGSRCRRFLADARGMDDLGAHFGRGLTEAEVNYLVDQEWARTSDDILWRRTKLGLGAEKSLAEALDAFLARRPADA